MSTSLNHGVSSDADDAVIHQAYSNGNSDSYSNNHNDDNASKSGDYDSQSSEPTKTVDAVEDANERRDRLLQIYLPNQNVLRWLIVKSLNWIVGLELFLYALPVFINYGVCPDLYTYEANPANRGGAIFVFAFFHFFSFLAMISATFVLVFELSHHVVKPGHLISMYFAILVHYGSWYQLVYAADQRSIAFPDMDTSTDLANRMVAWIYLSISIQSTSGIGDIYPVMWWSKAIAMTQMVLGLLYTTGMFGIGLDHFRLIMEQVARNDKPVVDTKYFWTPYLKQLNLRYPILKKMRRWAIRWILPLSVVIQVVQLGLLTAAFGHGGHIFGTDDTNNAAAGIGVVNFLCLLFQFFQFCIVWIASMQIIRAVNAKDMSLSFLIQSYIALMALFGGIFLTIYLFVGVNGFYFAPAGFDSTDQSIWKTFGELLWLSFVIMSTLGFGDCAPIHTAARIFVSLEMIVSVLYGIVVLGIAMTRTMHFWRETKIALPALPDEQDEHHSEPVEVVTDNESMAPETELQEVQSSDA